MTLQFYKCKHCGQIVAKVEATKADIICCGEPMEEMVPNTVDASQEKHVPVSECKDGEVRVRVGSEDHPMSKEHRIQWIYVETKSGSYFKCFRPEEKPHACFTLGENEKPEKIYTLCNIHGLWMA